MIVELDILGVVKRNPLFLKLNGKIMDFFLLYLMLRTLFHNFLRNIVIILIILYVDIIKNG